MEFALPHDDGFCRTRDSQIREFDDLHLRMRRAERGAFAKDQQLLGRYRYGSARVRVRKREMGVLAYAVLSISYSAIQAHIHLLSNEVLKALVTEKTCFIVPYRDKPRMTSEALHKGGVSVGAFDYMPRVPVWLADWQNSSSQSAKLATASSSSGGLGRTWQNLGGAGFMPELDGSTCYIWGWAPAIPKACNKIDQLCWCLKRGTPPQDGDHSVLQRDM
ncbi:hypothetical protein B0H13DRAFT_1873242 [Mycena leptocephala]|nr:hypothetical protein B0H13DRAFT_1873242 [Mycena leptocephala]